MLREHIRNLQQEIDTYQKSIDDARGKSGQKTEKVDRNGGQKTRNAILAMILEDAKVSSIQMAERLGINRSAVSKHLKKLQDEGSIKREGPAKGGKWVILNK